jgi:hypothetical protein
VEKSDLWGIITLLKRVILGSFITIVLIVGAFVTYLILCSDCITTIDTTGVYNLVNSENGEVIATDLTPEDITKLMEILNDSEN